MKIPPNIFNSYGSEVKIHENGRTTKTKAFIQPLRHNSSTYYADKRLPLGVFNDDHYLLIAPANVNISRSFDTIVSCGEKDYLVRSTDIFKVKDKAVYVWAVLSARTEASGDDYND